MRPVKHDLKITRCSKKRRSIFWDRVVKTPSCWLYGDNADRYGKAYIDGVSVHAHRAAKIWHSGLPPSRGLLARHKCRNKSCVRPSHIEWGTVAENARDRIRDGTNRPLSHLHEQHPAARLTVSSARAICTAYNEGGISFASLGKRYAVTAACIRKVVQRETWADATKDIPQCCLQQRDKGYVRGVTHHAVVLNETSVRGIRIKLAEGLPQRAVALLFGVSQGAVSDIKHRRTWKHLQ